jgi:TatD DNase family protein
MDWIDSHCHLDAAEFDADRDQVRASARAAGVGRCVLPAVEVANFDTVRLLAHQHADVYALGIHPLYTPQAREEDVQTLDQQLHLHRHDPRLVAVGEIGLDGWLQWRVIKVAIIVAGCNLLLSPLAILVCRWTLAERKLSV